MARRSGRGQFVSWDQRFFDPIKLPAGRKLVTFELHGFVEVRFDRHMQSACITPAGEAGWLRLSRNLQR